MTASDYPECKRMSKVIEQSQDIGNFLDWLNNQGIHLAEWETQRDCEYGDHSLKSRTIWRCRNGQLVHEDTDEVGDDCPNCEGTGVVDRSNPVLTLRSERYESLLARYFEIDLDKVETERRAMLAAMAAK